MPNSADLRRGDRAAYYAKYNARVKKNPGTRVDNMTLAQLAERAKVPLEDRPLSALRVHQSEATREARLQGMFAGLKAGYSVTMSCRLAGISPTWFRQQLAKYPDLDRIVAEAREEGTDYLEDILRQRATQGPRPSDILLIFMLKARRPEKFRDKYEITQRREVSIKDLPEESILTLADAIRVSREATQRLNPGVIIDSETQDAVEDPT